MTIDQLRTAVENAERNELRFILFTVTKKREPLNWDRVKVPGIGYGRCARPLLDGRYLVEITATLARRALDRLLKKEKMI